MNDQGTESLGHEGPSTESLGHESSSAGKEPTTFGEETIVECDGKVTEEQYKRSVTPVANDLMMHLNEGIRITHKAIKTEWS